MMGVEEVNIRRVGTWLLLTGILFTVTILLWIMLMILAAPAGGLASQLSSLAKQSTLYQWSFVNASLISPLLVVIMVLLAFFVPGSQGFTGRNIAGVLFLAPYTLLVSIAYSSQYSLFPRLLSRGEPGNSIPAAAWYFGNPDSMVYFMDLLGYAFFGISAILISLNFLNSPGIKKAAGWLLMVSGVSAIAGFAGYALGNPLLEQGVVFSGGLMLPFGILVFIWGRSLRRAAKPVELI